MGKINPVVFDVNTNAGPGVARPISDLKMLDRALGYSSTCARSWPAKCRGGPAMGRNHLDTFAASTDDLEQGGFNASLQVNELHA